jgi:nitrate reductase gamma subunit
MDNATYEILRGPVVWVAFFVFVAGGLFKLVSMAFLAKKEKSVFPTMDAKYGLRSVLHWVVPFGSRNMRLHPAFTMISFAFHLCLLIVPLFAMGHAVLWHESWGVSWASLPPLAVDAMTAIVICACAVFLLRRVAAAEVRNVTTFGDVVILLIVVAPFVTGFIAHQQWLPHRQIVVAHIVSGALWLMVIPFTRLSHMIWFVFSRAYMGSEFGKVRNARDW